MGACRTRLRMLEFGPLGAPKGDEVIQGSVLWPVLLRGAWHRAGRSGPDPLARNDRVLTRPCHDSAKALVKLFFGQGLSGAKGGHVLPVRRFAHAVTALLLIPAAFLVVLLPFGARAQDLAQASSGGCADTFPIAVLPAPMAPWKGAPLRVMVVAEKPLDGELSLIAPDGSVAAKSGDRHDGPPYFWYAE